MTMANTFQHFNKPFTVGSAEITYILTKCLQMSYILFISFSREEAYRRVTKFCNLYIGTNSMLTTLIAMETDILLSI